MAISKQDIIKIGQDVIMPGENKVIDLDVIMLPSATKIDIQVFVYRSIKPGPVVLILGGLHGDEINGVEIVRRTIASGIFKKLKIGSVIAIPLLNIYGFINYSREVPDGKDVNRSFPGNKFGSLASRVANILSKSILPNIDFGVDFHTGGSTRFNHPQIRFTRGDKYAEQLAYGFSPPYIIENKPTPKSLRKVAKGMGIPILIYEGGESLRWNGLAIRHGVAGIKRLLKSVGMLRFKVSQQESIHFKHTSWMRAPRAGLFMWKVSSGTAVKRGDVLGVINDPYGVSEVKVKAKRDGYIIGHNNAAVVSQGEALFHIGFEAVSPEE